MLLGIFAKKSSQKQDNRPGRRCSCDAIRKLVSQLTLYVKVIESTDVHDLYEDHREPMEEIR